MQTTLLDYKTTLVMVTTSIMEFCMWMFVFLAVINIRNVILQTVPLLNLTEWAIGLSLQNLSVGSFHTLSEAWHFSVIPYGSMTLTLDNLHFQSSSCHTPLCSLNTLNLLQAHTVRLVKDLRFITDN